MKIKLFVLGSLTFISTTLVAAPQRACMSLLYAKKSIDVIKNFWCPRGHFNHDQRKFVQRLAEALQPKYVLETGFCTGRSAVSVLSSCRPDQMISVDIDLDYMKPEGRIYANLLQDAFNCYTVIENDSKKIFTKAFFQKNFSNGIDWLTVDGDHSYAGCMFDLGAAKYLNQNGIIIIDDYKSGKPNGFYLPAVTNAVNDFCINNPQYYKVEWNCKGKGFAILTKSERVKDQILSLVQ